MGVDALARPVPIDAHTIHGIQGGVEHTEMVQCICESLLVRWQWLARQASHARAPVAGTPFCDDRVLIVSHWFMSASAIAMKSASCSGVIHSGT